MTTSENTVLQLTGPVLTAWREPGVLQIGFDGRRAVLTGVPDELQAAIELLHRPHSRAELAAGVPGLAPDWLDWLCEHLSTAGLLTRPQEKQRSPVPVIGSGRVAATLVTMLRRAGTPARTVDADAAGPGPGGLVVVATETAEPDRTLLNRLTAERTPHLVVRVEPTRAVVGPLVDPPQCACVRCDDLARTQLDRRWPVLLAQLCRTPVRPDAGLAEWAAATATAQVRCRLAGLPSEVAGRTLELGLADFRLRSRSWPVQPDCGYHDEDWVTAGTLAG